MDDKLEGIIRLGRIISEVDLVRYDTVIDQVHRLDSNVKSVRKGTSSIPQITLAFAIMIDGPIKIGNKYVKDTYLTPRISPFTEAFDCEIDELAGKPIRVYYQGTKILGMEPL